MNVERSGFAAFRLFNISLVVEERKFASRTMLAQASFTLRSFFCRRSKAARRTVRMALHSKAWQLAAHLFPSRREFLEAERIKYAIRLPVNRILQERIGHLLTRPVGAAAERSAALGVAWLRGLAEPNGTVRDAVARCGQEPLSACRSFRTMSRACGSGFGPITRTVVNSLPPRELPPRLSPRHRPLLWRVAERWRRCIPRNTRLSRKPPLNASSPAMIASGIVSACIR